MFRDVEVFCWTESVDSVEERSGNSVRTVKKYRYEAKWVPGDSFVDSRNFKDQKYNVNVPSDIKKELFANSSVRVGIQYSVSVHEFIKGFGTTRLTDLYKHAPVTAEFDRSGIWAYDSKNGYLIREKNPGKTTVGDVRVSYRVLKGFNEIHSKEIWASVCGVPDKNQIVQWNPLKQVVMPGKVNKSTFIQ